MSKEINIIEIVYLNQNGIKIEEENHPLPFRYFNDNGSLPEGNYNENAIEGTWVLVDGKHEVGTYAYRTIDDCTLIVEEDLREYLISELEKNYIDVNENWSLEELAARYNELLQQG
jgi:hypothetical protein